MKNIGKLLVMVLASSVMATNIHAGSDGWGVGAGLVGGMLIGGAMAQKREKVVVVQPAQAPIQQPTTIDRSGEYGYLRGQLDESRREKARLEEEKRILEQEKQKLEQEKRRLEEKK